MNAQLSESKTRQAHRALRNASKQRKDASWEGPSAGAILQEAERLEAEAAALLQPAGIPVVRAGEVLAMPDGSGPLSEIKNTLCNPNQAAVDASVMRTELLLMPHTDLVAMAVDAAESARADNSFEKMLAHQLALVHVLAMKTGARALEFEKRQSPYGEGFKREDSVELGRLTNALGRLTSTFQEGLLTLQRLKTGASQTVTVRHVTVEAGGQAVIGNVKTGGRAPAKRARGDKRK